MYISYVYHNYCMMLISVFRLSIAHTQQDDAHDVHDPGGGSTTGPPHSGGSAPPQSTTDTPPPHGVTPHPPTDLNANVHKHQDM